MIQLTRLGLALGLLGAPSSALAQVEILGAIFDDKTHELRVPAGTILYGDLEPGWCVRGEGGTTIEVKNAKHTKACGRTRP